LILGESFKSKLWKGLVTYSINIIAGISISIICIKDGTKIDDSCKSGGCMLMCKASPGNPWHNFISDTHRWVDGAGSTPCLNNGGIYHIASQYASIATMISNFAQTIFTTSANATFMGTPLPTIRFK